MSLADALDVASLVFLALGALLSLAAGVGLARFPDPLSRMHAATKPQIAGLLFVLIAVGLQSEQWGTVAMLFPILLFQMLTAPVSAHMVGRAAYRTKHLRRDLLVIDELSDAVDRAQRERASGEKRT
ncbi:monovalent cation/H(+) antiporter subunit G [Planctomonas psychrotolerans]|uniref:monovalent cation/H(+) antiporter subunit G n=1 Tax=Planctomonas psychrotolerans TaxID=2528712 RepID=UPI00123AC057|nr:monovalent cation/H(+) antiporter subunit G [Planctomonas psychrotolerans]